MRLACAALATAFVTAVSGAPAHAAMACTAFMDAFVKAAPDLQAQFVRPVVISRGGADGGGEARDVVTGFGVDARSICVGDKFARWEAQIPQQGQGTLIDGFNRRHVAGSMAELRWPRARAAGTVTARASVGSEARTPELE